MFAQRHLRDITNLLHYITIDIYYSDDGVSSPLKNLNSFKIDCYLKAIYHNYVEGPMVTNCFPNFLWTIFFSFKTKEVIVLLLHSYDNLFYFESQN